MKSWTSPAAAWLAERTQKCLLRVPCRPTGGAVTHKHRNGRPVAGYGFQSDPHIYCRSFLFSTCLLSLSTVHYIKMRKKKSLLTRMTVITPYIIWKNWIEKLHLFFRMYKIWNQHVKRFCSKYGQETYFTCSTLNDAEWVLQQPPDIQLICMLFYFIAPACCSLPQSVSF